MSTDIPRLTDAELDALLEAHDNRTYNCGGCLPKFVVWPCETMRLATEVRDLRAVANAARTQSRNYNGFRHAMNEFPEDGGAWSEWIDATDEADERLISALADYEEGGR